ncbi:hypothetical protein [Deinococcus humi]|uniref:Uncharacterized protein n=1 Tax=Deinococcus humi TaxID=662880 RepID=A0A7W8K329_9DEIO|nr:hypothetical protein [Deinococcus humi]MBB5366399.1 hypothetical protein [Deinococcus humi]GGO41570.1 hypothetical protein GCM10008949_52610 [Deinococcus humi]
MNRIRLIRTLVALSGTELARPSGTTIGVPGSSYSSVTPRTLDTQLNSQDFLLISVHIPYEGDLQGTDLLLPFGQVKGTPALVPLTINTIAHQIPEFHPKPFSPPRHANERGGAA